MKKKFLLTLVAIVCALCCVLGMAACNLVGAHLAKASCAVSDSNIRQVSLYKDGNSKYLYRNGEAKSEEIHKATYTIRVEIDSVYGLGTTKMSINGTDAPLTYSSTRNGANGPIDVYEYEEYNVTGDFKVAVTGAVEKKSIDIHFEDISNKTSDWRDGLNTFSLQVRILINGNKAAAPFDNSGTSNSIPLETFLAEIADNDLTVKADDHVDIYVFTTLGTEYEVGNTISKNWEGTYPVVKSEKYDGNDEDNKNYAGQKGYHYSFDVRALEIKFTINPEFIYKINR